MHITAIILLTVCLQVGATGFAQPITLTEKNASLAQVLTKIQRQTDFHFMYTIDQLQKARPIDISVTAAGIDQVLAICFRDQPFTYTIIERIVVVTPRSLSVDRKVENVLPPPTAVSGRILDTDGEPLSGASVSVKGSKTSVSTDGNGRFSIKASEGEVLVISYIGYLGREVKVTSAILGSSDRQTFIISLERSLSRLDEVQIIGYGTTTQRYNVGSVTKITAADIEKQPVSNLLATLAGRVPGMVVTQSSGVPGSSFQVQVRGQNTLASSPFGSIGMGNYAPVPDNPLFLIDGVLFAPQNNNVNQLESIASPGRNFKYGNPYGGISPFSSINPADIESVEVLRDADATAIYGSRASNGVILITTKKGKAGKTKLSGNLYTGLSRVGHTMEMMNIDQYRDMRKQAVKNDNFTALLTNPAVSFIFADLIAWDSTRNINWKDYFVGNTARSGDANLTLSGGNTSTQFLIGAGYHKETFIFPGDYAYYRGSINSNLQHISSDRKFSINLTTMYGFDQNNSSGTTNANALFTLPPNHPDFLDDQGNLIWSYKGVKFETNPMSYLKQTYAVNKSSLNSSLYISYKVLDGLSISTRFGYSTNYTKEHSTSPKNSLDPTSSFAVSGAGFTSNQYISWNIEPQAEYRRLLSKGQLSVLVGSTFQKSINNATNVYGSNYPNDLLLGSITAAGTITNTDLNSLYKYSGLFGRVNYIWDKEFILNLSARRDGSSRFGPGRQFGDFGSLGGGWIFSEQKLIKKDFSFLSYGKLRGSYGTTGTDNGTDYDYLSNWQPLPYPYQNIGGSYSPVNLYNPNYNWAVTKKIEVGLEIGLFKDRILASATWYRSRSSNQLIAYILPNQTGFGSVKQNFNATIQNSGWEIQLNSTNIRTDHFTWISSLILTIPSNKLIKFPGIEQSSYNNTYQVGRSLSNLRLYNYWGVNDTTGQFQFLTQKKERTYNPDATVDVVNFGDLDPDFFGSFRNSFSYGGFDVDVFFEFMKRIGPNYKGQVYLSGVGKRENAPAAVFNSWKQPGDHVEFPKFSVAKSSNYFYRSTGAYSDASYIRCKTVSIGYSLNKNVLRKIKIDNCRIYVNAQNLFTITHYQGHDPESMSYYSIPPLRTIVTGIQFTF
ncbi:MAG: SusC/RagA family TonB-linked outer membrane protein [Chitinophagaceae bacterium]|nr:SusC/RagA family TonB-linked outer membrane protein [Chitinophagaceae bacterium]